MENLYDVVVVGGGPAGLTAAIYLARAKYRVLVVEKEKFGGQITITSEVVNYPGIFNTDGETLTKTMREQAEKFGAEFLLAEVEAIEDLDQEIKTVKTSSKTLKTFGIILATGAHPRMIGFEGEKDFRGHGVAYCATCDGEFFTGLDVFVVGGGFAAAEESVFLTKYAKSVTILIRGDDFKCAKSVADEARSHEKIKVLTNTEVLEVGGETSLGFIRYKDKVTGEVTEYHPPENKTFGVFVFAGYEPSTDPFKGLVELDSHGYIVTDRFQKTNVEGIYGAGDVCVKDLRQVVTAVSDGAIAAVELEKYASLMHKKTGLTPELPKAKTVEESQTSVSEGSGFFTPEITSQLAGVFEKMESKVLFGLTLNDENSSKELEQFARDMAELTPKISVKVLEDGEDAPRIAIYNEYMEYSGVAFHGIPGGHEFNSFVVGMYNVAGPGQAIDEDLKTKIQSIDQKIQMKVMVSLSCTMCPELVMAVQRMASLNDNIVGEAYDIGHFPEMKDKYNIMSVPCLVANIDGKEKITFGKKNLSQLVEFIESN